MKEHVAEIVAAYVRRNRIDPAGLPALILSVSESLARLGQQPPAPSQVLTPAVPIRRSATAGAVICLDCGFKALMLRRHLKTAHGLSVEAYRQKWALPADHPVVARNYSDRRSELAKSLGLGRHLRPEGTEATER